MAHRGAMAGIRSARPPSVTKPEAFITLSGRRAAPFWMVNKSSRISSRISCENCGSST